MNLKTKDLNEENINLAQKYFPGAVTEIKKDVGEFKKGFIKVQVRLFLIDKT